VVLSDWDDVPSPDLLEEVGPSVRIPLRGVEVLGSIGFICVPNEVLVLERGEVVVLSVAGDRVSVVLFSVQASPSGL